MTELDKVVEEKVALSVEHMDSVDDIEGVKVPEASIADDSASPKACEEMHDDMDILLMAIFGLTK